MPPLVLHIDQAHPSDFDAVVNLYGDTARWLHERGIQQWPYPLPKAFHTLIQHELAAGELYFARTEKDPEPIGALYLRWSEDALWPKGGAQSGYLYGLAVHPRARGWGVGSELLAWVGDYAKRQGCTHLRLDCLASNPRLRQYYEAQGFAQRGLATMAEHDLALYEKRIGP